MRIRAHLEAGLFSEAEKLCRRRLDRDPADAEALHLLGLASLLSGDATAAIGHLQASLALNAEAPAVYCNLGEALRRAGRPIEGAEACRRAIVLDPEDLDPRVNLSACLHAAGDYREALRVLEEALALAPEDAGLIARKGDAFRELYHIHEALAAYERSLELDPDHAHAHANLGPLLLAVGRADEALEHCRRAIELDPSRGIGHMNLGRCLVALDQLDEAMDAYADANERMPPMPQLYLNIGTVWQEVGNLVQAEHWFTRALEIDPDNLDGRCAMAGVWAEAGRVEPPLMQKAIDEYRRVLEDDPEAHNAHMGLGRALWEEGDAETAVEHLRRAADLRPQLAAVHAQVGQILASAGEVKEATDSYYRALGQNERCVPALAGLAMTLRGKLDDYQLLQIERLLEDPKLREGARGQLHSGLTYYFDGAGDHARAAHHAAEANRLQWASKSQRGWDYDPDKYRQEIDRIIAAFGATHFERTSGWGSNDQRPVFVVGMPRSGTTLVEQILASHPQVHGVGERPFASRGLARIPKMLNRSDPPIDCVASVDAASVDKIANWHMGRLSELVDKAGASREQIDRIVDKMPDNYSLVGWIATVFPKAKIISCRRDPRDVALSCWTVPFGQIQWACDLEHIAQRLIEYQRIMAHWRQVLPVPMYEVDYEVLVADQEAESRKLIDHLGLEWDPACLEYYKTDRLVRTASVTQVRQPIYTKSVGRWKYYEEVLAPLLERLEAAGALPPDTPG